MHEAPKLLAKPASSLAQLKVFLAVGLTAVGVDSLMFFVVSRLGTPPSGAKTLSFIAGSVVAFFLNKYFTFARPDFRTAEVLRFACLYFSTLAANVAVFSAVNTLTAGRWPTLRFLAATGASTVLNYVGQRFWVFVAHPEPRLSILGAQRLRWYDYFPAWLCVVGSAIYLWRGYPSIFQDGEMWAESASHYFANAYAHSVVENFFILDFSYLPLFVRFWSLVVKMTRLPPVWAPFAYQYIALSIISACTAFFALPRFRVLMGSDVARVFVCGALVLASDYEVKTFISFSYYLAIVFYVTLAWCTVETKVSRRRAWVFGSLLAVAALSKPHFLSFAPILAILTGLSFYKRRLWASVLFVMPLAGCATQLLVALTHRAQITQDGSKPLRHVLSLWAQWAPMVVVQQLVGRAVLSPKMIYTIGAAIFGMVLLMLAWIRRRRWLTKSMWPLSIGISTLSFGSLLSITPYPHIYEPQGWHFPLGIMGNRHWFVPTVAMCLTIALVLGYMVPRRWSPLLIAAWLPLAWPFGWHDRPPVLGWPVTTSSAWQGLAPYVFSPPDGGPARGCIPINPHPWYYGLDCKLLLPLEDVHAQVLAPVAKSYAAPADAGLWSVDSIGLRLSISHAGNRTLVAYDAQEREVGRGVETASQTSYLTYFAFVPAAQRPHRVALVAPESPPLEIVVTHGPETPSWIWFGRQLPAPAQAEATSQAAR